MFDMSLKNANIPEEMARGVKRRDKTKPIYEECCAKDDTIGIEAAKKMEDTFLEYCKYLNNISSEKTPTGIYLTLIITGKEIMLP